MSVVTTSLHFDPIDNIPKMLIPLVVMETVITQKKTVVHDSQTLKEADVMAQLGA